METKLPEGYSLVKDGLTMERDLLWVPSEKAWIEVVCADEGHGYPVKHYHGVGRKGDGDARMS